MMSFPNSQAGFIEIDWKAGDLIQKYLIGDYRDGILSKEEQWAFEHLLHVGGYAPAGLRRSGVIR